MSAESQIKEFAFSRGASAVAVAEAGEYPEYAREVKERLAYPRRFFPWPRSILIIGVYAFDRLGDFSGARRELRGKIARTYRYYPVVRAVAEQTAQFIREQLGFPAVQGQQAPLKLPASRMPHWCYGESGVLLSRSHGSFTVDPFRCVNALGRKTGRLPVDVRAGMGGWFRGCDVCQEACPVNRDLAHREPDRRAGFEPRHHSSHCYLEKLEPAPPLIPLLSSGRPWLVRRNAAICLGNIADGGGEDRA